MDDINKRLVSVLDYFFNGNVSEMARKTNVPQPTLNNIVANRLSKPSAENLSRIANSIELLNSGWLLTGEGEMIKQPVRNEVEAVPEDKYIMAEYADLRSFAGRLGGSDIEQLPETHKRLLPREYEKGNYLVVREVEGGKYRFRADYAISLDFKELKERLKSRKNANK